jgi:hypothetical protein
MSSLSAAVALNVMATPDVPVAAAVRVTVGGRLATGSVAAAAGDERDEAEPEQAAMRSDGGAVHGRMPRDAVRLGRSLDGAILAPAIAPACDKR